MIILRVLLPATAIFLLGAASLAFAEETPETSEESAGAPVVTKAPKLAKFVEAVYPEDKKASGTAAQVLLSIEIGADGKVGEVSVVKSAGADFDASAIAAARQFLFDPAEVDHKPAPVKITYRYDFTIKVEKVKLGPQVNFEGVVLERFSKRHMGGVKVRFKDIVDRDVSTVTKPDGTFSFLDVPVGSHKVELSGATLITVSTTEDIALDVKKTVKYLVEEREAGVDEEVVVRAPRIKKESTETTIRTEEARRVPGTQGDTLKVVQNLPGVGRSSFGSGQLIVWGSAPGDTKVLVDGVEIPALYHVGGLRSTVNSDLVKSIDLSPGGYGADYGGGLGGLVRVQTRSLPTKGWHGYLSADVLDASAMITAALGPRVRFAIAGRYSYLDRILPLVTKTDFGDFVPIPRYDDYQAMLTIALRKDEELTAVFLASDDHLQRTIASQDPSANRTETQNTSFKRGYLRYSRILEDGASFSVTPSFGYDTNATSAQFGAVPTKLETSSWVYGLRASYRRKVSKFATLSLGLDLSGSRTAISRVGSVSLPAREGDVTVFGQPPGDEVNADDWATHFASIAPLAHVEFNIGKLSIVPGFRVGAFVLSGSRAMPPTGTAPAIGFSHIDWAADPRLQVSYKPIPRLTFNLAGGLYHQAPDPRDVSAVFGNPNLGLAQAVHSSLGGNVKITGTLSIELVGFFKYYDRLVVRNELPTPPAGQAVVQEGIGRSYGGQVLLRQDLWKGFFGWVTYSVIRSERKDHPDQAWRLFDYDQTHVLAVLASYAIGKGFTVGARFRYSTGFPRTPVASSFYDSRDDQFQPIFGAHNSVRIPGFYQLDIRAEKAFNFKDWSINLFVDVQNLTNRQNPEEIVYNYDYSQKRYITGLPTLAVFGLRLEKL